MKYAKRAVILAAGQGTRMRPLTDRIPKPLVPVGGVRMIDSILSALHQNDIHEIYVVVGYKKDQFAELPQQNPGLQLIENPDWETANNISSLFYARDCLRDTVILDGDQIVHDPMILHSDFLNSGYLCQWTDAPTEEWLLTLDARGAVCACSRTGGRKGWRLFSASFWTEEDGQKLSELLELEYRVNRRTELYWDDLPLLLHPEEFTLSIRPIRDGSLIELDSLDELRAMDSHY